MFCFQCQETAKNQGCTIKGVCGKQEDTSGLQDLLIFNLKGIAVYGKKLQEFGVKDNDTALFVAKALFTTITNANFDNESLIAFVKESLERKKAMQAKFQSAYKAKNGQDFTGSLPEAATWFTDSTAE
ncbi:MAG: hydroxylamine reductase, partial [Deltaproteobacteria bacterium]